ncbi:hypothetical protein [Legionella sp. PC997]|uniref:hypothetical protein n=1 Tax=Legionella sp. PC997 TaxID=2755562 RepID=UPI0015FAE366|nr:hypothetical protein [Legionella sp. PC997]QMT61176.1 hypothetical protein HBNCFIEN_02571 [Legionella sp. PC997]
MDAIQLARDIRLKRTSSNSHRFFFKPQDLSKARAHPLLTFYLELLKKINIALNKRGVLHLNEQKNNELRFLLKFNLLVFLTVTRQFNLIDHVFKTPAFIARQRHSMVFAKKIHRNAKQKKKNRLMALFAPKITSYPFGKKNNNLHDLSEMNQPNRSYHLSPELKIKKVKTLEDEVNESMLEYYEDELCFEKSLHSAGYIHNNLTFFTKCAKQSINIKNRPFMAQRLTFFSSSPQYKHRKTKLSELSFNLNDQKENNMRCN